MILLVNDRFGFGVLDALELVNNAKKWNLSVPNQVTCTIDVTNGYVVKAYLLHPVMTHLRPTVHYSRVFSHKVTVFSRIDYHVTSHQQN